MPSSLVWRRSRKLKRADYVHAWWMEAILNIDDVGVWAVQPAWTPMFVEDGAVVRMAAPVVRFYPRRQWWVAAFYDRDRRAQIARPDGRIEVDETHSQVYVDMATPALPTSRGVEFIDRTLDVVKRFDGTVEILDEDEVAENAALWSIPDTDLVEARAACDQVHALMSIASHPFNGEAELWKDRFNTSLRTCNCRS